MMISERHKTLNLVTIFSCWLCLYAACPATCAADEVFEVLPQSAAATAKSGSRQQDEVNVLAFVTPNATTAPRLDPNNNNEWRPLGHGDPLQKDPTYDYSPPALDRVRYWAENNASSQDARQKLPAELLRNKTKSDILLLGVPGERERSRPKQPLTKYAPIRRSYYAPPQQQQQQQQQQMQHMPHTHLMPPPMLMKGMAHAHVEYRHNVMNSPSSSSYMSYSSGKPSSSTHYYSSPSAATTSWYSHSPSMSSMSSMPQRMSYADAHHQESMQHYSLSRPQPVSYAPNSIHPARKPWLHELLQKELVVKPTMKQRMKPTMPATKYLMGTTRPQLPAAGPTHAPLNYAPVTFVPGPPTVATPTTSSTHPELYITPTTLMSTGSSGFRPMLGSTTTSTTTAAPIYQRAETASTTSSSRLMIPQTSNLAQRPTVAPAPELTTDALFSHYKQPPKPLLGPMYLIIEGHSKVKTYGQNELDPHSPKIVPVISKREPVVRIADPNEKRGTVETYQVKHLHTKTMPLTTTTSTTTTTTTTLRPSTESSSVSSSTEMPVPGGGVHDLLSLLDNMFAEAHDMATTTTGSSSLATPAANSGSTVLKPVTAAKTKLQPQLPEPRIGSQAGSIESQLEAEVTKGSQFATSTEPEQPPRATRQIFDYDQLPESRIKTEDELDYEADYDDDADDANDDNDKLEDVSADETSESEHNLLKRIDKFVDDVDDGDDDLDGLMEDLSPGNDNNDNDADDDDADDVDDDDEHR